VGVKVCVFGAGAVGGHIAGRLVKGGAEVAVVARGGYLDAIRANGLTVQAADGEIRARVAASDDPRRLGPQDWVIVTVKAPALTSVAAGIGPLLGPDTPILFLMNGIPWWYFYRHGGALDGRRLPLIDPDDAVWNAVGPERAVGGVAYSACTVIRPGVVLVENRKSRLVLGEPDPTRPDRLAPLAELLSAGGIGVQVTDRIRDAIWSKLILNMTSGTLAILTQAAPRDIFAEPAVEAVGRRIAAEVVAIAAGMDCHPTHDANAQVASYLQMEHKPSVLQDLELGRPMEIDGIFAAPLELARMVGVPTPTLDLLVGLVKVRARMAGLYR
jgi:2-dehydropantoate 2-reductase